MEKTLERETAVSSPVKRLVLTGLLAAMGCVATMVLMVPSPGGGYVNLGDAVVLTGAYLLGPVYGALAGGLGPALADLLAGYAMWVPGTLLIKGLMGLLAGLLYRALGRRAWALPVCALAAESVMVTGYWLYDGWALGSGLAASAASIPGNLVQGVFGLAASTALVLALRRSSYVRRAFPEL